MAVIKFPQNGKVEEEDDDKEKKRDEEGINDDLSLDGFLDHELNWTVSFSWPFPFPCCICVPKIQI